MMSRQEKPSPQIQNTGCDRWMIQAIEDRNAMRSASASARPICRAVLRLSAATRLAISARKMMLSMPSTISSTESVRSAIQPSSVKKGANIGASSEPGRRQLGEDV